MEARRHQGRGEKNLLIKMLTHRYGPLSEAEEGQVRGLKEKKVEKLAEAILDFQSREEFTTWLAKAQK